MIIAYQKTSLALLAGRKTRTRRHWVESHVALAERAAASGAAQDAWEKSPRIHGQKIGDVRILAVHRDQPTRDMPDEDWEAEGFSLMQALGIPIEKELPEALWRKWKRSETLTCTVIDFELIAITAYGESLMAEAARMYGPDWMKAQSPVPLPLFPRSESNA